MTMLVTGILLWSALHFIRALAPDFRLSMQERLGENAYKAVIAFGIFTGIVLMVMGWRAADQWDLYQPPRWGRPLGGALVLLAFLLFSFANFQTNVKRFIRHPQLTGMAVWAAGHLLVNGDNLSLTLFGGLGLWALVQMVLINRREGAWIKPDPVPLTAEIRPVVAGVLVFALFLFIHPYIFGVSPFAQNAPAQ